MTEVTLENNSCKAQNSKTLQRDLKLQNHLIAGDSNLWGSVNNLTSGRIQEEQLLTSIENGVPFERFSDTFSDWFNWTK